MPFETGANVASHLLPHIAFHARSMTLGAFFARSCAKYAISNNETERWNGGKHERSVEGLSAFARLRIPQLRRDIRHSAPAKCARGGGWLGVWDDSRNYLIAAA